MFKKIKHILVVAFLVLTITGTSFSRFPFDVNSGSGVLGNDKHQLDLTMGGISGVVVSAKNEKKIGYLYVTGFSFKGFILSDPPLKVFQVPARDLSSKTVSPDKKITVGWSSGVNVLPVNYRIYFGSDPDFLTVVDVVADQSFTFENLDFMTNYYWKIVAFDAFDRSTESDLFSFALSPSVSHLYAAPNPFRAGSEPTTFIFNMPGPGSAKLSIYLLPAIDLVASVSLGDRQDGINTYVFHGTDNLGQTLFNGVYLAVLDIKGSAGNVKETFKLMVVK